jgi:hypothetical protein
MAARLQARGWLRPDKAEAIIAKAAKPAGGGPQIAGARPKASAKRRLSRAAAWFAAIGVAAGVAGLIVGHAARQTNAEAEQLAAVRDQIAAPTQPTPLETAQTDARPSAGRVQGYLDAQNVLTSAPTAQARQAAAEFVAPALLEAAGVSKLVGDPDWRPSAAQAASGAAPLHLAVSEASGDLAFRADPACAWSSAPTPENQALQATTLALCQGAGGEVYGWAELTWEGGGADALITAVHVGWSSAHLRQKGEADADLG